MRIRFPLFVLWILLCLAAPVLAQLDCPDLAEAGISTLAVNCRNLEANTVCYGSDLVESTFVEDAPPVAFDSPGDRAFLSQFTSVHSLAADLEKRQWGIAAVGVNAQPDNQDAAITMLVMGDTTLLFTAAEDDTLPPFQFTTVPNSAPCAETPSILALRGDADTQLTLNGSSLRFAADSVVFLHQQSANSLTLTVESGQVEVTINGANEPDEVAQGGQTLAAITDNAGTIILWSAARAVTDEETQTAGIALEALIRMADEVLVATPQPAPTEAPVVEEPAPTEEPAPVVEEPTLPCGPDVIHVVQRGETVFRIAMRYGTTVDAIAAANNLDNPRLIHSGLQLRIPCPGTVTYAPPVTAPDTGAANPPPAAGTCTGGTYVVQTGDTLYSIALRFGTTVEAIAAANGITDINAISIGQTLNIPCGGGGGGTTGGGVPSGAPPECAPFLAAGIPCP